jgi:hypothetical protein
MKDGKVIVALAGPFRELLSLQILASSTALSWQCPLRELNNEEILKKRQLLTLNSYTMKTELRSILLGITRTILPVPPKTPATRRAATPNSGAPETPNLNGKNGTRNALEVTAGR